MRPHLLPVFVFFLLVAQTAQATVLLQFQTGLFADDGGTPTNGMDYAIVVDTAGDGFDAASGYDPFDILTDNDSFLNFGGSASDDFYTFGNSQQVSTGGPPILFEDGYFNEVGGVDLAGPIDTGDLFGVIWFPTNSASIGEPYGFLTDPNFLIPPDGFTSDYSPFIPQSVVRSADFSIVPEPSTLSLVAFGAAGLAVYRQGRRRREGRTTRA